MEQQNEKKKNTWGGYRAGAGRKKSTVKTYGFNAPQEVVDILENVEKKTDFINQAIKFYAAHLQKK